jgi:hypothetical protein
LFGRSEARPDEADPLQRIDYSYRVYWTRQARDWDVARRRAVAAEVRTLTESDAFEANAFERRYRLDGLDGAHAGASLLALIRVMEAFDADE